MFLRLLITIIAVIAAITIVRHLRQKMARPAAKQVIDKKTARCAKCNVYFPQVEAVKQNGRDYCSAAHAAADRD